MSLAVSQHVPNRNERVYAVVSLIPAGTVATYRQVAALAQVDGPAGARQVGYALSALRPDTTVPWHRVVNVKGKVSPRGRHGREHVQNERLALEGVEADAEGYIDMTRYEWNYII